MNQTMNNYHVCVAGAWWFSWISCQEATSTLKGFPGSPSFLIRMDPPKTQTLAPLPFPRYFSRYLQRRVYSICLVLATNVSWIEMNGPFMTHLRHVAPSASKCRVADVNVPEGTMTTYRRMLQPLGFHRRGLCSLQLPGYLGSDDLWRTWFCF